MRYLVRLSLLVALFLPGLVQAQEVTWRAAEEKGWVGISVLYSTAVMGEEESTVVVIDEVAAGSPAEEAGIRVGDTLTHLDGQPISREVLSSLVRTIEVGDLVRFTLIRDGRPRDVLVEAAPQRQEAWVLRPDAGEVIVHLDSIQGAILKNLDSLRLSIAGLKVDSAGDVSIQVLRTPSRTQVPEAWDWTFSYRMHTPEGDSLRTVAPGIMVFEPELTLPFQALLVTSEETRQLREDLKRARNELTEVRRTALTRERELRASIQGPVEEVLRRDSRLQELREREVVLEEEVQALNQELEQVSEAQMRRQFAAETRAREERARREVDRYREEAAQRAHLRMDSLALERQRSLQEEYERRRPLNYLVAGQSFVAGAQLQPLNPDLASYFQVDQGILVVEVLEGTPASEAGLLAGDVIVRVGGEDVESLKDFRFGIGYLERPLRIRVIRKGEPLTLVIR